MRYYLYHMEFLSHSLVRQRIRMEVQNRVATFLQAFVRSWYGADSSIHPALLTMHEQADSTQMAETDHHDNQSKKFVSSSCSRVLYGSHACLPFLVVSELSKPVALPPPPPAYQFGQPDVESSIVIAKEPDPVSGQLVRVIKYASSEKAIEHATFPVPLSPGYEEREREAVSHTQCCAASTR